MYSFQHVKDQTRERVEFLQTIQLHLHKKPEVFILYLNLRFCSFLKKKEEEFKNEPTCLTF